jgi:flagellar biosynthesis protein FlhB
MPILSGFLTRRILRLVESPPFAEPWRGFNPAELSVLAWQVATDLGTPVFALACGCAGVAVLAHQLQAGGFWQPGLLAPEARRLWVIGSSGSAGSRWVQMGWRTLKGLTLAGAVLAALLWDANGLERLRSLEPGAGLHAAAVRLSTILLSLATACLALGGIDYWLRFRRVEALLRMTPEEEREDRRNVEGDPEARGRRLRLARQWRLDAREIPSGVVLAIGGAGSTLVLVGGDRPPGRIMIRAVARGVEAAAWRRTLTHGGIPTVEEPSLARALARPGSGRTLPPRLVQRLTAVWPAQERSA